jgi:hypothetical protein
MTTGRTFSQHLQGRTDHEATASASSGQSFEYGFSIDVQGAVIEKHNAKVGAGA